MENFAELMSNGMIQLLITAIIAPIIGVIGNKFVEALKRYLDGKLDQLERLTKIDIEAEARARIFEAIDTAAEIFLEAIGDLERTATTTEEDGALKKGLAHVKESMKESLQVIKTTDDVLLRLIRKAAAAKVSELTDKVLN